jgi:hypothetical protein
MLRDMMIGERSHASSAGAASLPVLAEPNSFIHKHFWLTVNFPAIAPGTLNCSVVVCSCGEYAVCGGSCASGQVNLTMPTKSQKTMLALSLAAVCSAKLVLHVSRPAIIAPRWRAGIVP